ncbi:MAG: hypothetical protein HZB32_04475 [Nitrospirae bacterium]|nr:hypothetical protein [Nitrospirota bacterium]
MKEFPWNERSLEKDIENAILRKMESFIEVPPIGRILCAKKKHATMELLELEKSGIHVASILRNCCSEKCWRKSSIRR